MRKERENNKLCYINGVDIIEYATNKIDDIVVELQKIRLQKGISLYKLAQMTGLAHTTIMRIENLSKQPSLDALMRIALALEANFDIWGQTNIDKSSNPDLQSQLPNGVTDEIENQLGTRLIHQYQQTEIGQKKIVNSGKFVAMSKQSFTKFAREFPLYSFCKIDASKYIDEIDYFLRNYIISVKKYDIENDVAKRISEFSNNLVLVLREYYIGQHTSAYELFSEAMNKINLSSLYYSLPSNQKLYRARECAAHKTIDKDAFLHIPFEKRTKVSSQRYSFPGLPCLYMGTSVEVCLKELGERNNPISIAELQVIPNHQYYILDLTGIFKESVDLMNTEARNTFLELLPLVFLCSTRISEDHRNVVTSADSNLGEFEREKSETYFRPDYIIPQLLLEYILDKTVWRENPIIGIQYYSVQENFYSRWLDGDFQDLAKIKNVVIPVRTNSNRGYCKELDTMFRVSQILKPE